MEQAKKERELREEKRRQEEEANKKKLSSDMEKEENSIEPTFHLNNTANLSAMQSEDIVIEIKSYHSSEENYKKKK
jgi:hypothetical protein